MNNAAAHLEGFDALCDEDPHLDFGAGRRDRGPIAVAQARFLRQLGRDFAEHFGLKLGKPGQPARHGAGGVLFSQAVRRDDVGEARVGIGTRHSVIGPIIFEANRIALLAVERILEDGFQRLVMRRERAVLQPGGSK